MGDRRAKLGLNRPSGAHAAPGGGGGTRSGWFASVVVAVVVVAAILVDVGLASCGRQARVNAWVSERSQAAERVNAALAAAHEKRVTELEGKLADAQGALNAVVAQIEGEGYEVGYYVATLGGEELLSLNPDEVFYGASSIKGPYVLATYPDGVPSDLTGLVEEAIQWSDNEAYWTLRNVSGFDTLSAQLESLGVDGLTVYDSFVHLTPRQLAGLWLENRDALLGSKESAAWFRALFDAPLNAPISELEGESWSKGGWIETSELNCTVDAGIVRRGENAYVMAAMISKGEDTELLRTLVRAIDAAEQAVYELDVERGTWPAE